MPNWLEEAVKEVEADKTPLSVWQDRVVSFMCGMWKTHATRDPMPAGGFCVGGGSKSSRKREKSKKPSLATLNQRLYTQT